MGHPFSIRDGGTVSAGLGGEQFLQIDGNAIFIGSEGLFVLCWGPA
jgi:hypothetical protein